MGRRTNGTGEGAPPHRKSASLKFPGGRKEEEEEEEEEEELARLGSSACPATVQITTNLLVPPLR